MRVAVVAVGISGLVSAHVLAKAGLEVVLYEMDNCLDSASKTFSVNGVQLDLAFMPFNQVTYPNMMEFFTNLGLHMVNSDNSFSVSLAEGNGYEWSNRNGLSTLFSQKGNMINPYFIKMLWEMTKFKNDVLRYIEEFHNNQDISHNDTLLDFIKSHGYSELFQKAYLVPICSSLWSCPAHVVMRLSAFSALSYFHNHHLFQIFNGPQWYTVKNGSQTYIKKIKEELSSSGCQIRTGCAIKFISKHDDGCLLLCEDGSKERFYGCIIDANAHETLRLLGEEATNEERKIFGAFNYVYSDVFLHNDESLMPPNRKTWSALNFLGTKDNKVCLTYWLNVLQNLDDNELPFLVTLNPSSSPKSTLHKWSLGLSIPSVAATKAILELDYIQGKRKIWFCGGYQGYGILEDGVKAGMVAANGILKKSCEILNNPKTMVPSLMEVGARSLVVGFLQDFIAIGTLILLEEGGVTFTFEGTRKKNPLKVYIKIQNPRFYWKLATEADLGLAGAYINGDFSFVDKTEGLLNMAMIFIVNYELKTYSSRSSKRGWWTPMLLTSIIGSAKYFFHHVLMQNSVTQALRNISHHYDLSNEFFSLFLDETMTYSCALFKSEDEDFKVAQMRKISSLIKKARVDKDHQVLDIGCGWGSLAIEIVKQTGCKYTGITLSEEQLKYAETKVKEAGLEDQIKFLLCDYRQLPDTSKYDRIISCEMIEHVGHEYYEEFFGCCDSVLAEDGILVLQFISVLDARYDEFRRSPGIIKEYIFPGVCVPSLSRLTSAMAASSRLCVEHVENIGAHYYQTLRNWRKNLMQNQSKILALGFNEEFIRTFECYFDYVAAGFKTKTLGDYQVVFSRPGNVATFGDPYKAVISTY
ncbi:uncharacterized protein LOC111891255 isoform X1 [Lactuca sativa]|uniref:uncharacterized protein LOC111891255 isoform X1 n=2 Tax=Lactuca sativa TaxID=4236 RepID=UPI000CD9A435|nr:uncharacterized protein LOC111891255 isoform X1 [Lactuca sativa]